MPDNRDLAVLIPSYLDDYPLDPEEFRLYAHIARRVGKNDCFESVPNMAKHCRMNRKKAQKALQVLTAAKMISGTPRSGKTTIYTLEPMDCWASPEEVILIQEKIYTTGNDVTRQPKRAKTKTEKGLQAVEVANLGQNRPKNTQNDPPIHVKTKTGKGSQPENATTQVKIDLGQNRPTTQVKIDPPTQVKIDPPTQVKIDPLRVSPLRESNLRKSHEVCNNAHADVREDTHTQAEGDPVKVSCQEAEASSELVEGEIIDPWEQQPQKITNSLCPENCIDSGDQCSAAPRDNKDGKPIKYNGLTVQQVEQLQEQFDNGEVTDLPRRQKIALAMYTMPEVSCYRKSGKILSSKPNDIDPAFLRFFALTQWNGSTDLDKARNTIIKYESSLERWNVLYSVLQRWVESRKNPEKGYQDLKAEAMERIKNKRQPVSRADIAIISDGVRVTASPQQVAAKKEADRKRQELLNRLQNTGKH